jgi:hypothetical protein
MRSIERALSQLVSGSAQGLCPALASLSDRFGFQRVGHRRIRDVVFGRDVIEGPAGIRRALISGMPALTSQADSAARFMP